MKYFLDTVDTIPDGVGFAHFGRLHILWLVATLLATILCCVWYKRATAEKRNIWKKAIAILIVLDEIFKMVMLTIGGRYTVGYLPLHLCSINIFVVAIHAWKPNKTMGNFLYTVCIPGALAALLFPSWSQLPLGNFMHIHSFTIHALLAMYPIVLAVNSEIEVRIALVPKCLLMLVCMAVPVYVFNVLFDTNFMFLMEADPSNPLYFFEQLWGNHLYGFPVIITGVIVVMYVPLEIYRKIKSRKVNTTV